MYLALESEHKGSYALPSVDKRVSGQWVVFPGCGQLLSVL